MSGHLALACECDATIALEIAGLSGGGATCPSCGRHHGLALHRVDAANGLTGCASCGHPELYTRKDFPRVLGFTILGVAAVLAPFTYYLSLGVAALLDLGLYHSVPEVRVCYVCLAEHRGFAAQPRHPRYDPEIADRVRFGDRAVMGKPMRPGGTADGPEPEH